VNSAEKKNTVLVVDDENSNLLVLISILSPEYTVYTTKSGLSAIELANKYLPDIILLDILMPGISGFDVLAALKASDKTRNIPVIIITGLETVEDEEKGLSLDAADFIHKPFSANIVRSRVRNQIQIVNKIHELVRLHEKLEAAGKAAETANQYKSVFLARMSHEIRSPLNAVIGLSESQLKNENLPPDIREIFFKIYSSGDLLLEILNDLLDTSKIEAGKLRLVSEQYHIENLIRDTAFLSMMKYESKPITFNINVGEDVPSILVGDALRIKQILNNLLSNAFKYTNTGTVELSIAVEEAAAIAADAENSADLIMLVICVRDTGQGMTKEQVEHLFEEYTRFNSKANKDVEGVGLGMNITHNLTNIMNGKIQVESEPGKGSLFAVRLPQGNIGAPALGKEAAERLRQSRPNYQKETEKIETVRGPKHLGRALLVDDMEINLFVAEDMLAPYGVTIDTASSGLAAIEKIKNNTYDIVFMDHMMPEMDGVETAKEIRKLGQSYEQLPIVALTANAVSGMREMFIANGFNDFVSKPIRFQELNEVVKKWIPSEKILLEEDAK